MQPFSVTPYELLQQNMNMITLFEVRLQPQNRLGTAASKYDTKHLGKNNDKQNGCIFARSSLR